MANKINYREICKLDKEWIDTFIKNNWGSKIIVVHKTVHTPSQLHGFIAENTKKRLD